MSYTIVFNTLPIQNGGGLQKALSLLTRNIDKINNEKILVVCYSDSHFNLSQIENRLVLKKRNRFFSEFLLVLKIIIKYSRPRFFTLSGPSPWPLYFLNFIHITECSYSNLFYNINFWNTKNYLFFLKKKFIDIYRFYSCKFSTITIFQTEKMLEKAIQKGFSNSTSFVVKPAINYQLYRKKKFSKVYSKPIFKVLFLCSEQRHKRIELFNYVLEHSNHQFALFTTMDQNSAYFKELKLIFNDKIKSIGKIESLNIVNILDDYDIICNLSLLESFSNNFIEAWGSKRLLLCVKEEWSFSEGKDSAIYLDLFNIKDSVRKIDEILSSNILINLFLNNAQKRLSDYNNYSSKYNEYLKIIKNA